MLLSLGTIMYSWACECKSRSALAESVKEADVIISGHVLSKVTTSNYDSIGIKPANDSIPNPWFTQRNVFVKIKVDKSLKGKLISDTILVVTNEGDGACEALFSVGDRYIVFAYVDHNFVYTKDVKMGTHDFKSIWTNTCMRNTYWHEDSKREEDEIIALAKQKK